MTEAVFSPNGAYIITSSFEQPIRILNLFGEQIVELPGSYIFSVSPDGRYIATIHPTTEGGNVRLSHIHANPHPSGSKLHPIPLPKEREQNLDRLPSLSGRGVGGEGLR